MLVLLIRGVRVERVLSDAVAENLDVADPVDEPVIVLELVIDRVAEGLPELVFDVVTELVCVRE